MPRPTDIAPGRICSPYLRCCVRSLRSARLAPNVTHAFLKGPWFVLLRCVGRVIPPRRLILVLIIYMVHSKYASMHPYLFAHGHVALSPLPGSRRPLPPSWTTGLQLHVLDSLSDKRGYNDAVAASTSEGCWESKRGRANEGHTSEIFFFLVFFSCFCPMGGGWDVFLLTVSFLKREGPAYLQVCSRACGVLWNFEVRFILRNSRIGVANSIEGSENTRA
ncbi:hypothetical protein LZ31DRAFT_92431 [Colletotrichum somersetense]|nr:hypothetical protein LZ31DRAFT_92431 [Colletotrichum somersetense]